MFKPSIRKKIILFTVVPITLFYNILSALHIYSSFKASSHEIEIQMHNTVVHFAQTIDAFAKDIHLVANAQTEMHFDTKLQQDTWQQSLLSSIPFAQQVNLLSKDSSQPSLCVTHLDKSLPPCIPAPINDHALVDIKKAVWTPLSYDPRSKNKLISYIRPITINQEPWLLKLDININQLVQTVIDPKLFEGKSIGMNMWKFNMADLHGDYLYTDSVQANRYDHKNVRETGKLYGTDYFWNNITELIQSGKTHTFRVWIPNPQYQKEYWFFGAPVPSASWWLYTSVSRQHALKGILTLALVDALVMTLSLLLILTGILYASKKITKPLIELKGCMNQFIQHHQIIHKPNVDSRDETGSLASSFVELTQWLAHRDEALQEARANNMGHIVQALQGRYFYFQLDANNQIIHISPSIESVLGYKTNEFTGLFTSFLNLECNGEKLQKNIERIIQQKTVMTEEFDAIHKNGQIRRLEIFWSAVQSNSRKSVIEGLANDVTEHVSDTLKFKALLDSAPDAMVILNPEGIIVMVNARAINLLGFTPEELVNMPLSITVPPDCRANHPLLQPLHDRCWKNTQLFRKETKAYNRSGQTFPAELTSNPLITRDGVLISVVVRDITERKHIEQELIAAHDKAISASHSKSLFLSCMSHELRTPLNGVIGYAQVLQRSTGLSSAQHQKLKVLERCGHSLLNLINDILDLTKIETHGVKLHLASLNLRETINEVQDLLTQRADSKSLLINVDTEKTVPTWIECDGVKLRQILINLVGNAIKYTNKGHINIYCYNKKNRIYFDISDTGIGIKPENIEIIFDPFQQLNEGLKTGGAGLGLAICQHLAKAMGDKLSVKSSPGKGSCFSFSIPLVLASAAAEDRTFSSDQVELILPGHKKYSVLIVDDLEVNRTLLSDIMMQAGFITAEANNGLEAIEWLQENQADLVMMDILMPIMSGIEALKEIRKTKSSKELKIIVVTASVSENVQHQLKDCDFDGSISKPFVVNHLLQMVASLLNIGIHTSSQPAVYQSPETLPKLPDILSRQLKRALVEAMDIGDIQSLHDIAKKLTAPEFIPYHAHLRLISDTCDMEALETLIQALDT